MSVKSMRTEKLHAELFDKMLKEQRAYIENLKTKTPDEILNHAFEYLMRGDFLDEMELIELNERQIRAMLAADTPLANLYRTWSEGEDFNMKDIKCTIENYSADEVEKEFRGGDRKSESQKSMGQNGCC